MLVHLKRFVVPKVFDGFTVVELADRRNQLVGKLMADSGARVIQIEPITGSSGRWIGPFVADQEDPNKCLDYWWYNTGKESICIDVTRQPGQDLLRQLLLQADVFIESTRPGTLQEYGLDFESIAPTNSGLVYASLTDFGQDGPWIDLEMNDPAHLALGGQMAISGYTDSTATPIGGQGHQAYNMASIIMLHTVTAALYERLTSGAGQQLDVSIHDCCAIGSGHDIPAWLWYSEGWIRQTGQHAAAGDRPRQQIPTGDGRYLHIIGPINNFAWVNLIKWMDEFEAAGDLKDDKWLDAVYRTDQLRSGTAFEAGLTRLLANVTAHDAFLRAQSIGLAWTVVRAPEENLEFNHYKERDFWAPVEHAEIGKEVLYPRGFFLGDELGQWPERRAPHLGEHTHAVLQTDLGMDATHVDMLASTGVVR